MILRLLLPAVLLLTTTAAGPAPSGDEKPDFNRDVRPILSGHCFKCHGPDDKKREGKLRLDDRATAIRKKAIAPGKPDQSGLIPRIFSTDPEIVMPPPGALKPLSDAQKETLKRWIASGADYEAHWAFVPPKPPALPAVRRADRVRNPIDRFVLAKLESLGLDPNPPADRATLARRLSLDLTGLPPTPEEADLFIRDPAPDAIETYVDRLLASPHYGERWARRWLDLARYADTNGYEKDRPRVAWPWRDWVIRAYNDDLPFDRFTIEQLAGDMLPNATAEQKIATGFHRNTMLNEEGGVDPLEFRYHALVDRVNTTGTVWLGLTLLCANCHTHKYDPVPHADYFRLMAFLDHADEPELAVPSPEIALRREEHAKKIAAAEAALASRFPPEVPSEWTVVKPLEAKATGTSTLEILEDGSVLAGGETPEKETITIAFDAPLEGALALKVEAMIDDRLPQKGPGRAPNGNFVLSEIALTVAGRPITFGSAEADFAQDQFPASAALDGKQDTGWAVSGKSGQPDRTTRSALFTLDAPLKGGEARWSVKLDQQWGQKHLLGRVRLSVGRLPAGGGDRAAHLEKKLAAWIQEERSHAIRWEPLRPVEAKSAVPTLEIEADGSVFVHGDQTKSDTYDVRFGAAPKGITAIRLETLTDERLPRGGPGRVSYEGPFGDFFLSELSLLADGKPVRLKEATQTFAAGDKTAARAIDGDPQTGWSVAGGVGRAQTAVFRLEIPLDATADLSLRLLCERYYAAGVGRFRLSVTTDAKAAAARGRSPEAEAALLAPGAERSELLRREFLASAKELAGAHKELQALRDQMPKYTAAPVFHERDPKHRRTTVMRKRGEYLQPAEAVEPGVLSALPILPGEAPRDRLGFARWLADPANPLPARVAMNRLWGGLFGRAIVRTTEDFGMQGESPTHPELLDWLALEFVRQGGSQKRMIKTIVTSAAYLQDARVRPEAARKDPDNRFLSRGPRVRLDAEQVRDAALRACGLLSPKIGGPSVFPPQPASITSEGTYGPLAWTTSQGEDRYRRGLYTFAKRTAPYAMSATFDAPSGEACTARRESSNTPLQALTLLNDEVFAEATRHAGGRAAAGAGPARERLDRMFRAFLTRPPTAGEADLFLAFHARQRDRLLKKELDAAVLAGPGEGDPVERAAWALVARALLNLDEFITRN